MTVRAARCCFWMTLGEPKTGEARMGRVFLH